MSLSLPAVGHQWLVAPVHILAMLEAAHIWLTAWHLHPDALLCTAACTNILFHTVLHVNELPSSPNFRVMIPLGPGKSCFKYPYSKHSYRHVHDTR